MPGWCWMHPAEAPAGCHAQFCSGITLIIILAAAGRGWGAEEACWGVIKGCKAFCASFEDAEGGTVAWRLLPPLQSRPWAGMPC